MSDTPETDYAALLPKDGADWRDVVLVEFARNLERERDAFEQEVADVRDVLLDALPHIGGSTKKLAELLVEERDLWKENSQSNRDEYNRLAAERDKLEMERDRWKAEAERWREVAK